MKISKTAMTVCVALLILILAGCSKAKISCAVCAPECEIAHITNPGGGTTTSTYCGSAGDVAAWETSIDRAMTVYGGSAYFTSTSATTSQNVCTTSGFDSVTYYRGLGYTCH